MLLTKTGEHCHELETSRGAVLFSYRDPVAARVGMQFYHVSTARMTTASRRHLREFLGTAPAVEVSPEALLVVIEYLCTHSNTRLELVQSLFKKENP